ncbi:hypothetical protein GCM10007108_09710 [Thermogymnomonas acidicola]|uniref:Uncharacterized protein n=1 Tax=Thermogymnomonas acidicola TaxID=399579 RepID=A0AA37F9J1_9ARCH|nr:hypothetical protein [Thermogymnomonas acidicola]GGM73818.1 hypothetical protein GCM10007108_09710 [Thermogymnomonas acidicola]
MKSIMNSRARYPLFFTGLFVIELAGLLLKFAHITELTVEVMAGIGFVIFLLSFIVP